MKWFATRTTTKAVALIALLLWAQPAHAAIANVQLNKTAATGAATSINITVTALTGGNVIYVAGVTGETNTLTPTATGVTFGSPVLGPTNHSGAASIRVYLWRGVVDSGGATTVTITANVSTVIAGWVMEFSGVLTSSDTDQTDTGESAMTATSHDYCSITTTTADQVIVVVSGSTGARNWTAGANYTAAHSASLRVGGEYRIVSATGTYASPTSHDGAATDVVQQQASFKAPVVGGAGPNAGLFLLGVGE